MEANYQEIQFVMVHRRQFFTIFNKIVNETSYSDMLKWIKDVISEKPKHQANLFIFNTLTGLRPIEVSYCIDLIHTNLESYWNREKEYLNITSIQMNSFEELKRFSFLL